MKSKHAYIMGMVLMAGIAPVWGAEGDTDWKRFAHPGIVQDGREGRTILDQGEFIVIDVKEGEAPLGYTLGPMKTRENAVIDYTIDVAVESVGPETECTISLLARDEDMKELAPDLGQTAPDFTVLAPMWQTLGGRAVMPPGTHFVEMRLNVKGPMKVYTQKEAIRAVGLWNPTDDPSLHRKARISNGILEVVFNPEKRRLGIMDNRIDKVWQTFSMPDDFGFEQIQTGKLADGNRVIVAEGVYRPYVTSFRIVFMLAPDSAKLTCKTEMAPDLKIPVQGGAITSVPQIKAVNEGHRLIIPIEGIQYYPTDQEDFKPMSWDLKTNPAWFGLVEGTEGPAMMCIVSTFQHAAVSMNRSEPNDAQASGTVSVKWLPCEGTWDYPREVTFWFAETGGVNALTQYFYNRTF